MSRWSEFRNYSEDIPETSHEAAIFLNDVHLHLRQQECTDDVLDARKIISGLTWKAATGAAA